MAKPIFIVKIPFKSATKEIVERLQIDLECKFVDYYCIVVPTGVEVTEFQCLNSQECDEVKFEELKQMVRDQAKQNPKNHSL
jgi:hypothetical protein